MKKNYLLGVAVLGMSLCLTSCNNSELTHTHTIQHVRANEPTCLLEGNIEYYHCTECLKNFSDSDCTIEVSDVVIRPLGHQISYVEGVAGTDCQHKGTIEYYQCSNCSKMFEDEQGTKELLSVEGEFGNHLLSHVESTTTCTEDGEREHYHCTVCLKNYVDETATVELTDLSEKAFEHLYTNFSTIDPTTSVEGKRVYECEHGCGTEETFKILKRPANLKLVNKTLSWEAVENSDSYRFAIGDEEFDNGAATSIVLSEAQIKSFVEGATITVRGVTALEEYVEEASGSVLVSTHSSLGENLWANINPGFETTNMLVPNDFSFNHFPYGNYSDQNNGVGGWYYIEKDGATNTALKVPAVVWWPGNTTMKKAIQGDAAKAGTYEISFDIKASQTALEANNNGNYGTLKGYMWDTGFHALTTLNGSSFSDAGLVVKDIPGISTTSYTNVRLRYTLEADSADLFNTFNLTYWPEGYVGEDNFVWVDNIQVFKIEDDVVGTVNIDAAGQGDLEGENFGFTDQFTENRWYNGRTILIEGSSVGSEIITEDNGNRCLKVYAKNEDVAFDLFGNVEMKTGGMYKMSVKIKAGSSYQINGLDCTAWRNDPSGVVSYFNWFGFDLKEVNSAEWVTVSAYFYCPDYADLQWFNVFFNMNNHGTASNDLNNYLLFDDFSVQAVTYGE